MESMYKDCVFREREKMIDLWEKIVNIDSNTMNIEGMKKMIDLFSDVLIEDGIESYCIDSEGAGPIFIGEINSNKLNKEILLIGHMDTVFKEGSADDRPFFIENGKAYGPGVLDMKAGLVIAIYVLKILKKINFLDYNIKCIFFSDEENLHMFSNAKQKVISQCKNAIIALNFETGYLDDSIVISRNGGGVIEVNVSGVQAHSGIAPENGRNAILVAARKIEKLEKRNDYSRKKMINCGVISGGIGPNTIPGNCKFEIGFRFPTQTIKNEILEDIATILDEVEIEGTKVEFNIKVLMECMEATEEVLKLYNYYEKIANKIKYGKLKPVSIGGVSDSGIFVTNGIPTICGLGVKGEKNHTTEEYAIVDSLFERTLLAIEAIKNLGSDYYGK